MTTASTTYQKATTTEKRRPGLRQMIAGAAVFDGVMGVACLVAVDRFGGWLSVPSAAVATTGGVFLVAALIGVWTARRAAADVRPIVAANAVFALWCLVVLTFDNPNMLGAALLVVSAIASAGTAVTEHQLARR